MTPAEPLVTDLNVFPSPMRPALSAEAPKATMDATEELQILLGEVSVLANQLRKAGDEAEAAGMGAQSILKVLGNDGALTVPEIARIRSTSRQNIQILVNRLESEGCVELARNPAHQRSSLVRITDRGHAVLEAARREESKSFEKMLPHLAGADMASAAAVLRRIRDLLVDREAPVRPARQERRSSPAQKPVAVTVEKPEPKAVAETPKPVEKPAKPMPEDDFPLNLL
jgi:DNA-binding MarR family transcriptional regulator